MKSDCSSTASASEYLLLELVELTHEAHGADQLEEAAEAKHLHRGVATDINRAYSREPGT
jgi:hypothetical protein